MRKVSMKEILINDKLLENPYKIKILKEEKKIGDIITVEHEGRERFVVLNNAAKILDLLLVEKKVNAIDITDDAPIRIYLEVDNYKITCGSNKEISYDKNKPLEEYYLLSAILLSLSKYFYSPRLKQIFSTIVNEYTLHGYINEILVAQFCNTVELEMISANRNNLNEFALYNDLYPRAVKEKSYDMNKYTEILELNKIQPKPDFNFLSTLDTLINLNTF